MSQRGGSVTGDVRFGEQVFSPMVPAGEADFLLVLEPTQVEPNRHLLRPGGVLITPDAVRADQLPHKKTLNVALLGALSAHLPMAEEQWLGVPALGFAETFFEGNRKAFLIGRSSQGAEGRSRRSDRSLNDMSKETQTHATHQGDAMESVNASSRKTSSPSAPTSSCCRWRPARRAPR